MSHHYTYQTSEGPISTTKASISECSSPGHLASPSSSTDSLLHTTPTPTLPVHICTQWDSSWRVALGLCSIMSSATSGLSNLIRRVVKIHPRRLSIWVSRMDFSMQRLLRVWLDSRSNLSLFYRMRRMLYRLRLVIPRYRSSNSLVGIWMDR